MAKKKDWGGITSDQWNNTRAKTQAAAAQLAAAERMNTLSQLANNTVNLGNNVGNTLINSYGTLEGVKKLTQTKMSVDANLQKAIELKNNALQANDKEMAGNADTIIKNLSNMKTTLDNNSKGGSLSMNAFNNIQSAKAGNYGIGKNPLEKTKQAEAENEIDNTLFNISYNNQMMNKYGKSTYKDVEENQKKLDVTDPDQKKENEWIEQYKIDTGSDEEIRGSYNAAVKKINDINARIKQLKNTSASYNYDNRGNSQVNNSNKKEIEQLEKEKSYYENIKDNYKEYAQYGKSNIDNWNKEVSGMSYKEKKSYIDQIGSNGTQLSNEIAKYESGQEFLDYAKDNNVKVTSKNFVNWMNNNNRDVDSETDNVTGKNGQSGKDYLSNVEKREKQEKSANKPKIEYLTKHIEDNIETLDDYEELEKDYQRKIDEASGDWDTIQKLQNRWATKYDDKKLVLKQQSNFNNLPEEEQNEMVEFYRSLNNVDHSAVQEFDPYNEESRQRLDNVYANVNLNYPNEKTEELMQRGYTLPEAEAILSYAKSIVNRDIASEEKQSSLEQGRNNPVSSTFKSIGLDMASGVGAVSNFWNMFTRRYMGSETPIDWNSQSNRVSQNADAMKQGVEENIESSLGKFVYEAVSSTAESAATIPLNVLVPGATMIILGSSAAEKSMIDAHDKGMSDSQALANGISSGIFEGLFEQLSLDKLVKGIKNANTIKKVAKNIITSSFIEGSEEVTTELANMTYDYLNNGDFSDYNTRLKEYMAQGMSSNQAKSQIIKDYALQLTEAGAGGAIGGLLFGAVGGGSNYAVNRDVYKATNETGKGIIKNNRYEDLKAFVENNHTKDSDMYKLMQNTNPEDAYDVGFLASSLIRDESQKAMRSYNINQAAAVQERLEQLRVAKEDSAQIAKNLVMNTKISEELSAEMTEGKYKKAVEQVKNEFNQHANGESVEWINKIYTDETHRHNTNVKDIIKLSKGEALNTNAVENTKDEINAKIREKEQNGKVTQGKSYLIEDPDTSFDIVTLIVDKNGETKAVAANTHETYNMEDVAAPKEQLERFEYGKQYDAEARKIYFEATDRTNNVMRTSMAFEQAYEIGKEGLGVNSALHSMSIVNHLSDEYIKKAYEAGYKEYQKTMEEEAKRTLIRSRNTKGSVRFNNVDETKLNDTQKAAVHIARMLSNTSNVNFEFFESSKDKEGKYVGENGSYDWSTNTIRVDINAGKISKVEGRNIMNVTIAHEMTHFMEKLAPEQYAVLQEFVFDKLELITGENANEMIDREMARLKERDKSNNKAIKSDKEYRKEAKSEITARACESVLTDKKAIKELAVRDKGLFGKLKNHLDKFLDSIEKSCDEILDKNGNAKDSAISQEARAMKSYAHELRVIWNNALDEASGNEIVKTNTNSESKLNMLRANYKEDIDNWYSTKTKEQRLKDGGRFLIGTTSNALNSINVKDMNIYFGKSKIQKILDKHPEMTLDLIKQVPEMLEKPIIIMDSTTRKDSLVILGELYTSNGVPIMASLLIDPKNKKGTVDDFGIISNGYARKYAKGKKSSINNYQHLIDNSTIRYVEPNKNRTNIWLKALGLHLPSALTKYGPTNKLSSTDGFVNIELKQDRSISTAAEELGVSERFLSANLDGGSKESTLSLLKSNGNVRRKFLNELGLKVEPVLKEVKSSYIMNDLIKEFVKTNNISFETLEKNEKIRNDYANLIEHSNDEKERFFLQKVAKNRAEDFLEDFNAAQEGDEKARDKIEREIQLAKGKAEAYDDGYALQRGQDKLLKENEKEFEKFILSKIAPIFDDVENVKKVFEQNVIDNNDEYVKKAEKHYGITDDYSLAAYIDTNGKMIDFSSGGSIRGIDHRGIAEILDTPDGVSGTEALTAFMNAGNVRIMGTGIDISVKPNEKQKSVIRGFADSRNGEIYIDFSKQDGTVDGSAQYSKGTSSSKIIADIDEYFRSGTLPENTYNSLSEFRYQDRSLEGIYKNMPEEEREEILRGIKVFFVDVSEISVPKIKGYSDVRKMKDTYLKDVLEKSYYFEDVGVKAYFGITSFGESLSNQNGNLNNFYKAIMSIKEISKKAKSIKITDDRKTKFGFDTDIENYHTMIAILKDGNNIIPVKIELKENKDPKYNSTKLIVTLDVFEAKKIEDQRVPEETESEETESTSTPYQSSSYNVSQIIENVKSNFIKYFPDGILSKEQLLFKEKYLIEEVRHNADKKLIQGDEIEKKIKEIERRYSYLHNDENKLSQDRNIPKTYEGALSQNERYRAAIDNLREQFKITKGHKVGRSGINRLTAKFIAETKTSMDKEDIKNSLDEIFNKSATENLTAEETMEELKPFVAKALNDRTVEGDYRYGFSFDDSVEYAAAEMLAEYSRLPEVKTYADKQQDKLIKQQKEYESKISKVRSEYKDKIAKYEEDMKYEEEQRRIAYVNKTLQKEYDLEQKYKARVERRKEIITQREENHKRTVVRNQVKKNVEQINKMLLTPTIKARVPEQIAGPISGFISSIDFGNENTAKRYETMENNLMNRIAKAKTEQEVNTLLQKLERLKRRKNSFTDRVNELKEAYEKYKSNENTVEFNPVLEERLKQFSNDVKDTSIYDMDLDQTKELNLILQLIKKEINNYNEMLEWKIIDPVTGEKTSISDVAKQVIEESNAGKTIKAGTLNKTTTAMLDPKLVFDRLGGWHKNNAMSQLFNMLNEGQEQAQGFLRGASEITNEIVNESDGFGLKSEKMQSYKEKDLVDVGLKNADGETVKITRGMMVELYMGLQYEDNLRHMIIGGLTIPDLKGYYKGDMTTAFGDKQQTIPGISKQLKEINDAINEALRDRDENGNEIQPNLDKADMLNKDKNDLFGMQENNLMQILANIDKELTPYEKKVVKMTKDVFDYTTKKLNDVSVRMYGAELFNVNGYYPIATDKAFLSGYIEEGTNKEANLGNSGFAQARIKSGKPIILGDVFVTVGNQLQKNSKYYGYLIPQHNLNRVLQTTLDGDTEANVTKVFQKNYADGMKYLDNFKKHLFGGASKSDIGADTLVGGAMSFLRGNAARATLTLNPKVMLSQTASLPGGAAIIGYKPIAKSLFDIGDHAQIRKEINDHTNLLWDRESNGAMLEIADIRNNKNKIDRIYNNLDRITKGRVLDLISKMDSATVVKLWKACKYYVEDTTNLNVGSEEYFSKVTEVWKDVVQSTQPNYTALQRNEIQRSSNEFIKSLTMYKTQPFKYLNLAIEKASKYKVMSEDAKNGKFGTTSADVTQAKKDMANSFSAILVANSVFVIMGALMTTLGKHRKDDDLFDEEGNINPSGMVAYYSKAMGESIFGMLPLGSDLYDAILSRFTGDRYYGLSMNGFSQISDLFDIINNSKFDTVEDALNTVDGMFELVSTMLGIPVSNFRKYSEGIKDTIVDVVDDAKFNFSNSENSNKVKMYLNSENQQQLRDLIETEKESIKTEYPGYSNKKAEEKAKSKVRSQITKNLKEKYLKTEKESEKNQIVAQMKKTGLYKKEVKGKNVDNSKDVAIGWLVTDLETQYKKTSDKDERKTIRNKLWKTKKWKRLKDLDKRLKTIVG